jgi:hypothetical protein
MRWVYNKIKDYAIKKLPKSRGNAPLHLASDFSFLVGHTGTGRPVKALI